MDNVCRFCLKQIVRKKATSISNHQFKAMLRRVFPFEIDYDEEKMPMKVCGKCFSIVREFHWYSQKVQAVQELLERQFYTAKNASSCPVPEATVDDDADGALWGWDAKEPIGFNTCDLNTRPTDSFSDIEIAGSKLDTQRTEQDVTPVDHIDSDHCSTHGSDSNDSSSNINEKVEGEENELMQCEELTNDTPESITATVHTLGNERLHAEVDDQPATITAQDKGNEPLAYSTTVVTEYDQSTETINDYFQGLSEIVISDTAGWFEDVQNIICEEVPLLEEIFTNCNFAVVNEFVEQEAEPYEPSQRQDRPPSVPTSYPCSDVTVQVKETAENACATEIPRHESIAHYNEESNPNETVQMDHAEIPRHETVAHYNEDSEPNETEEMNCGYEKESGAPMSVSLEDLKPSDGPAIADTEHQTDSTMSDPHVENVQTRELHEAIESIISSMSIQEATTAAAHEAGHEWINGHFEDQNDGFNDDEHNHSNLIDHVQEVPYEEVVYSEEATEDQSAAITEHATVLEVSTERELNKVTIVAENVSPCHSDHPAQPASSLPPRIVPSSSSFSGFLDVFSRFVQAQNMPMKVYDNGKTNELEPPSPHRKQAAAASISSNQHKLPTKLSKYKKRQLKASNELDDAIEKYFDLQCELCPADADECFTNFDSLTAHFRKVHDLRGYARCCGKQYFYRRQLMEHIDYHRGLLRCSVCDRSFTTRATLKQHENVYHRTTTTTTTNGQYPCTMCTKVCDSQKKLLAHQCSMHNRVTSKMQQNQGQRTNDCETCGASFSSELRLNNHMRVHGGNKKDTTTKPNNILLPCVHCDKVFRSEKRLNSHTLLNHPKNPFSCEFCSYLAPNMRLLRKHKRNVHAVMVTRDSRSTMAPSEPRLRGFVDDASLLALQQHYSGKTSLFPMNGKEVKSNVNKATAVAFASEAYSTP